MSGKHGIGTLCVHGGYNPQANEFGAAMPPIYQTSTFAFPDVAHGAALFAGEEEGYIYTRIGNPTIRALENCVTALEGGADGLACSSGMAAWNTLVFGLLKSGDHIICGKTLYAPSRTIVEKNWSQFGIEASFVDTSCLKEIEAAWRPNTKLLFFETPANPNLSITDIADCARLAHANGAILVVDNTFMSPILQRPFGHGADWVIHSVTKFLNGHSDVVGGIIIAHHKEQYDALRPVWYNLGATMDPHQAWLVLRGVKTLKLRVLAAQENAREIAYYLKQQPTVEQVMYPELPNHPGMRVHQKQTSGPGSLISFELKGGVEAGVRLMNNLQVMTLAVSLGGVETLIEHPASMTHSKMSHEQRMEAGISDGLVRLSVGCEDVHDLIDDLAHALCP